MVTLISWLFVSWIICSIQLIIDSWINSSPKFIIVGLFSLSSSLSPRPLVPLRWLLSSRLHSADNCLLDHWFRSADHCFWITRPIVSQNTGSRKLSMVFLDRWLQSLDHCLINFLSTQLIIVSSPPYSSQLTVYIVVWLAPISWSLSLWLLPSFNWLSQTSEIPARNGIL